jgi:hypothetical protein
MLKKVTFVEDHAERFLKCGKIEFLFQKHRKPTIGPKSIGDFKVGK